MRFVGNGNRFARFPAEYKTMAKFYAIQIGSIYLTSTGAADGLGCKLEIESVEDLMVSVTGNSQIAADGSRIRQTVDFTKGKEFSLKISTLTADVYTTLKNFLNTANETGTSFPVSGTGASGDFIVTAKPSLTKPFSCAGFNSYRIKDIVLRFET